MYSTTIFTGYEFFPVYNHKLTDKMSGQFNIIALCLALLY